MGGYQVGSFPAPWREWNGKYRDAIRRYWKGDDHVAGEIGHRLSGSADLYQGERRRPQASINFITAHDGFTLHDLVTYSSKHNEANGEWNKDGADDNQAWNHGVEGETDDPQILELRERQKRNLLATLLSSQGVPMLVAGDEMGRTQGGNNNAYCQDNEISWIDWNLDARRRRLLDFTRRLIAFRHKQPGPAAATFLPWRVPLGFALEGSRLVPPRRGGDERRGLDGALPPLAGLCARWRRHSHRGRTRPAHRRRFAAPAPERAPRTAAVSTARRERRRGPGCSSSIPAATAPPAEWQRDRNTRCRVGPWRCSGSR